jgi:hypothetical protein
MSNTSIPFRTPYKFRAQNTDVAVRFLQQVECEIYQIQREGTLEVAVNFTCDQTLPELRAVANGNPDYSVSIAPTLRFAAQPW